MKSRIFILLSLLMGLTSILSLNLSHARTTSKKYVFPVTRSTRFVTAPPTNFTIANLNDAGTGSLRQAILDANATVGADTISVAPSVAGTILLTSGQLMITGELTINGPGAQVLAISGNSVSRVFDISGATVSINGLTIMNGKDASGGGGVYNSAGVLTITNSTVSGNTTSGFGGGILNTFGGILTITNCTFSGNSTTGSAFGGGGIFNGGTLIVANTTLTGNSGGSGGGIENVFGTMTITNSTLSDNFTSSGRDGGGIFQNGGEIIITNSTVSGNSGRSGGGIMNIGSGKMTLINSTLSNNSATNIGGGISNPGASTLTIINSTLSDNSASNSGGGIHNFGTVYIKNSIVANSQAGGDCAIFGFYNPLGINLSTDSSCPGFNVVPSTGIGGLNLGPLANNGGPTKTHALLAGSMAIDRVTDCTDVNLSPNITDQRGVMRPLDGDGDGIFRCDAGAYEVPTIVSFDLCIQDDSNGSILKISSTTGDYQFTNCSGFTISGTGGLTTKGSIIALQHYGADRRILAKIDSSMKKGTASIQIFGQWRAFTIMDRNITNNACACIPQ